MSSLMSFICTEFSGEFYLSKKYGWETSEYYFPAADWNTYNIIIIITIILGPIEHPPPIPTGFGFQRSIIYHLV